LSIILATILACGPNGMRNILSEEKGDAENAAIDTDRRLMHRSE